jgi:hypothetical protein
VFTGDQASTIKILLTPVYYTQTNTDLKLSGYKASLKEYSRGSIKSDLEYFNYKGGVRLDFQVYDINFSFYIQLIRYKFILNIKLNLLIFTLLSLAVLVAIHFYQELVNIYAKNVI